MKQKRNKDRKKQRRSEARKKARKKHKKERKKESNKERNKDRKKVKNKKRTNHGILSRIPRSSRTAHVTRSKLAATSYFIVRMLYADF